MCLSLGHLLHNFSGIEWFLGVEQIAVTGPIPMRAGWGTRALERGILVKIAVVKLRQFRKLRLVEHRHAPPADIDDSIVTQLPDDAVGMHRRDAERFADLLLGQRHFERVTRRTARDGKSFHALRRTTGTRLIESGAGLPLTAQILGHARIDSSRRYFALASEQLRQCCLPLEEFTCIKEGLR